MPYYPHVRENNELHKNMTAKNYQTGAEIGTVNIEEDKYEAYVAGDSTATGAVKAGEWLSNSQLEELAIEADLTVFFE